MAPGVSEAAFTSTGLSAGVWHGTLRAASLPRRVALMRGGSVAGPVDLTAAAEPGVWCVTAPLPADWLCEGAQTYILIADDGEADEPPRPGASRLGSLPIVAGAPLAEDLVAEVSLLRAEIELLKREFRRLTTEF